MSSRIFIFPSALEKPMISALGTIDSISPRQPQIRQVHVVSDNALVRECLSERIENRFRHNLVCDASALSNLNLAVAGEADLLIIDTDTLRADRLSCIKINLSRIRTNLAPNRFIIVGPEGVAGWGATESICGASLLENLLIVVGARLGLTHVSRKTDRVEVPQPLWPKAFTPRECDVAQRLLEGKANKAIAVELGLSANTVKTYVTQIMRKLRVRSRTQVVLALGSKDRPPGESYLVNLPQSSEINMLHAL